MLASPKIDWRNRTDVGSIKRFMGFYESPKEILACSYNCNAASIGISDSAIAGFSSSAIYLYPVLIYRGKVPGELCKKSNRFTCLSFTGIGSYQFVSYRVCDYIVRYF